MNKQSLEMAKEVILNALDTAKINQIDKAELMLNITKFLDKNEYDKNIKVLSKVRRKDK